MITKFEKYKLLENYIVNNQYQDLIKKIQSVLTPDLLKGYWKKIYDTNNPMGGHCYIATEALYWMLGGPNGKWKPYVLSYFTWPEGLDEGETHWFLKNEDTNQILDVTKEQFGDVPINYSVGTSNGMMSYPNGGSKRAREIIRRVENLSESKINESAQLSGKHSFLTFLQIISNHDYHFVLNESHTKMYDYHMFFSTETIKDIDEFIDIFKYKKSLESSYEILLKIRSNKLTFFFGIKDDSLLRYGFLDLDSQRSYVAGEFRVSGEYFGSISKYKALQFANRILNGTDVKKLPILAKIKKDFEKFYKSKKNLKIKIIGNRVINYFDKEQFTEEDINMNRLYRTLDSWISKKSWKNNVEYSVDDTTEPLEFIIIVK